MIVGIDFDNTVINYDTAIYRYAVDHGFCNRSVSKDKKAVRDAVRMTENGEMKWQSLQAYVYGPGIMDGVLNDGVTEFIRACSDHRIKVYIISHKTRYAASDETRTDLRACARSWMSGKGFLDMTGLSETDVYFADTRLEKIDRIIELGCTHFVDDLLETFIEPEFPEHVVKILFSPHPDNEGGKGIVTVRSFHEIGAWIFNGLSPEIAAPDSNGTMIRNLTNLTGKPAGTLVQMAGGRNSRVYRLTCEDGTRMTVKHYHRNSGDTRNRLDTEFRALSWLYHMGVTSVPQALFRNGDLGIGVYGFIDGKKASCGEATENDIREVLSFTGILKRLAGEPESKEFSPASDACFCGRTVLTQIESRLEKLKSVSSINYQDQVLNMKAFLYEQFEPALGIFTDRARRNLPKDAFEQPVPVEKQTLSPSDFGFHNAIRNENGRLFFVDFEYFGWDDPAKLMADFLLHPAMDLTIKVKGTLKEGFLEVFSDDPELETRFQALYPLFGLKWCTILLNEFRDDQMDRRTFSSTADMDRRAVLENQMNKAETMLNRILENVDGQFAG